MRFVITLVFLLPLFAANFRLFLKDGGHHMVSEYKVESDRVKYHSTERGDWEEIPLDLVDLQRTEGERKRIQEVREAGEKEQQAEDQAERALVQEIARVPRDPGVHLLVEEKLRTLPQAEVKVVTDKKRSILKYVTPIPIVSGKATIEVDGEKSANATNEKRPEFYVRQSVEERIAIVRMGPKKGVRVVEKVSIVPVVSEAFEELDQVETFRRQFADGLFKVWPTADLPPGEYALVQYTEGKMSPRVWDFRIE